MLDGANTRRVTLTIRGVVQGVFFRESSRVEAARLGLAASRQSATANRVQTNGTTIASHPRVLAAAAAPDHHLVGDRQRRNRDGRRD